MSLKPSGVDCCWCNVAFKNLWNIYSFDSTGKKRKLSAKLWGWNINWQTNRKLLHTGRFLFLQWHEMPLSFKRSFAICPKLIHITRLFFEKMNHFSLKLITLHTAHGKIIDTLPLSKLLGLVESGRWNQESEPPSSSHSRRLEKVPSGPQDHCLAGPWSQDHHCLAGLWTLARGTPATATGMIGDLLM